MAQVCQVKRGDLERVVSAAEARSFCDPGNIVAFAVRDDEEPQDVLSLLLTRHLKRTITPEDARMAFAPDRENP